jgi:8-oxo-dGTP pyrophosphatase MutT (NUDIX family)
MNPLLNKSHWRELLGLELPGEKIQQIMAPSFRGSFQHQDEPALAAVLALLYPSSEGAHLIFIKRNEYEGPHSAQVSFPGGAWEEKDGSLENTAIRETREELGIWEEIEILGALTPLYIPVSNFRVSPFLGWIDVRPEYRPDHSEVQYVIEASMRELLEPANCRSERIYHHDRHVVAPFYLVGEEKIWGATAMLLSEILQLAATLL